MSGAGGGSVPTPEQMKAWYARAWSAAPFQPLADTAAPVHDALVERLQPRAGERWLDVASGTGAVALRAARAGASVSALDLSPRMVATAEQLARRERLSIDFRVGDAERMPYAAGSFDVVTSAQGVMFALDHAAAARELARVCRPGGRLGLTVLACVRDSEDLFELWARFTASAAWSPDPLAWGRERYLEELLGDAFELETERRNAALRGRSGEDLWRLHAASCGPIKLLAESLDPGRRAELRDAFVTYYERYRTRVGVSAPREFLLVIGRRREPDRDRRGRTTATALRRLR